jgi:acylphosphatase
MIQYEIKVTGRVQGVWYRKYAEEKANELGIKGWVKNSVDGGVQLIAQGEDIELETFIDWLLIGPPLARVNKITKTKMNLLTNFDNFTIQY